MSELHKPERITWYKDEFTGNTMDRTGMQKLMQDLQEGKLNNIVCWRLDRLGRTAAGLTKLRDDIFKGSNYEAVTMKLKVIIHEAEAPRRDYGLHILNQFVTVIFIRVKSEHFR